MDTCQAQKILKIAKEAAIKAGEIHLKYFEKQKEIEHKSNKFDLVTNADKEAENIIIATIKEHFKNHDILAEESTGNEKNSDFKWVIDPLDGTTNYSHNFPHFCASIGLMYKNELHTGVVYDALKKELFYASKGQGAYLNDKQISVSSINRLSESLLATGFPYNRESKEFNNLNYFEFFRYKAQGIRRPGAAALDLCYLACGRIDGFWELQLAPWDTAAGAVIVREAGGIITNFSSNEFDIFTPNVIASNKHVQNEMLQGLREAEKITI